MSFQQNNLIAYKFVTQVFLLLFTMSMIGQTTSSREIIKALSSEKMHGRGYVNKGDSIAAHYIRNQFIQSGILPLKGTYYQSFSTSVNTFPRKIYFAIDSLEMIPAVDFLIAPTSPSLTGSFKVKILDASIFLKPQQLLTILSESSEKVVFLDCYNLSKYSKSEKKQINDVINYLKYGNQKFGKAIVMCSNEKLTWGGSSSQATNPFFILNKKLNLDTIRNVEIAIESDFIENYRTQNCIGYIPGASNDSLIVLTAHYDHLGRMGKDTFFPGANDNASGIALLLKLASHFAMPENKPKYDIVCIAFAAEEIGLLGSKHFVENPLFPLKKIKFLLNFDLAGTGDEGIKVVNGSVFKNQFELLIQTNENHKFLKKIYTRGEACNSDHCWFYKEGVPCFYIYTLGGSKAYHDIHDTEAQLSLSKFENFYKLLCHYIVLLQKNL